MRARRTCVVATTLATAATLMGVMQPAAQAAPTELFFSEYIEGSSNNKALEIFNGTGAPVDLAAGGYQIRDVLQRHRRPPALTISLTGTVANGDVYVVAQAAANAAILAQADQTTRPGWFNGDDAVVLRKAAGATDRRLDRPGRRRPRHRVGHRPDQHHRQHPAPQGDHRSGRHRCRRRVRPGREWDGFATDTFDGLGAHALTGGDQPAALTCGGPADHVGRYQPPPAPSPPPTPTTRSSTWPSPTSTPPRRPARSPAPPSPPPRPTAARRAPTSR